MNLLITFVSIEAAQRVKILYGDKLAIPNVKKIIFHPTTIQWEAKTKHDGYALELIKHIEITDESDE